MIWTKIEISNQVTKLSYALIIVIVLCSVLFIYMFSTINSLEEFNKTRT